MKKIAFFLNGWTLTSCIMQLAEGVARQGVPVDIFCDESHRPVVDWERITRNSRLRILTQSVTFNSPPTREKCSLFMQSASEEIFRCLNPEEYGAVIGIEKVGGALAFLVSKKWKIPLLYWSLELYDQHHDWWRKYIGCPECWMEMEALVCKLALAIIIQDKERGDVLSRLKSKHLSYLYLPVTIGKDEIIPRGGYFLHDLCNIHHSQKILLQFGNNRMSLDWMLRMAQSLPNSWSLVLHGLSLQTEKMSLQHSRLAISTERIPEISLPALVASASAGLVHYEPRHINDVLTAHASEKLARYLAAGIPAVAHDVGNFAKAFAENRAGITYREPEQVGMAVRLLDKKPEIFQQAALHAGQGYLFENAGKEIVDYLCHLVSV